MKIRGKKLLNRDASDADTGKLLELVEGRRHKDLEVAARAVLASNGRHAFALKALSFALIGMGRDEEALPVVDLALRLAPTDGELHNNRGIALAMLMRWDDSIASFAEALRWSPNDPEIHKNLGHAWFRMGRWNEAVAALLKAIEIHPDDYVEAIHMLAMALINANRMDEAATVCEALRASDPNDPGILYTLIYIALRRCDWTDIADMSASLRTIVKDFQHPVGNAGFALPMPGIRSGEQLAIARNYASHIIPARLLQTAHSLAPKWRPGARRLKLGYLSCDFRRHPVGSAVVEVIERHDRERIESFGYSIGEDDGSELRRRFAAGFEHFVDASSMSVHATASRIRDDGIDILVDLSGWTGFARIESLAIRCAPIQVSWLGYAGTLGHAKLADYLIGDAVATPQSMHDAFVETIVHMPNSFMPLDTRRRVGAAPTRQSQGLPEDAFVLCSFNNSYKFNPGLFDLWCRLLASMPDAVLWLPRLNDTVAANLKREVEQRGIDHSRLVLAQYIESATEHFGRMQLADLALDTFPFNSHSTGADTLWAGVPMVTKLGDTFAGRVGASLLTAAGLPELVAGDEDGYSQLVLDLYRDRPRLTALRRRLAEARDTAPLFDMAGFTRDLENLYFSMAADALRPEGDFGASGSPEPATEP